MERKKLRQLTKEKIIDKFLIMEEKFLAMEKTTKLGDVDIKVAVEKPKIEVLFVNIEDTINFGKLIVLRKKLKTNEDRPSKTPDPNETQLLVEQCVEEMLEKGFIYTGTIYLNRMGTGGKLVFYKLI